MRKLVKEKVSELDHEMHSSVTLQQDPKKIDNLEIKNLEFGRKIKRKKSVNMPQVPQSL